MPRGPRLDAPGTLHHVILRGIERRDIVCNDKDRDDFRTRMGDLALSTATSIFAWALMNNHAHILLRSGPEGLPVFMRRFLTGYAVSFNRRRQRCGHLFQNRYKSIICQENAYFTELVRYIHLNPLRAGIVASMAELTAIPGADIPALWATIKRHGRMPAMCSGASGNWKMKPEMPTGTLCRKESRREGAPNWWAAV